MIRAPQLLLRRAPWHWVVPFLAAAPMVWSDGSSSHFLGDNNYFLRVGGTLFSSNWTQTYADKGVQAGPVQLALYGAADRLSPILGVNPGRLLAPLFELGIVALLLAALQSALPQGRRRQFAQAAMATLAVLTVLPSVVFQAGHPADAVIPLLWVLAACDARRGRPIRAGLLVGLSANFELWGVLGAPILLLLDTRLILRAGAALGTMALGPFAPFVLAGSFEMFSYRWPVTGGTLVSLFISPGSTFPWTLRLVQGAAALAAGAGAVRLTRDRSCAVCVVPLAVVSMRLLLDPMAVDYYLAGLTVLALTAAGFVACYALPSLGPASAGTKSAERFA